MGMALSPVGWVVLDPPSLNPYVGRVPPNPPSRLAPRAFRPLPNNYLHFRLTPAGSWGIVRHVFVPPSSRSFSPPTPRVKTRHAFVAPSTGRPPLPLSSF